MPRSITEIQSMNNQENILLPETIMPTPTVIFSEKSNLAGEHVKDFKIAMMYICYYLKIMFLP